MRRKKIILQDIADELGLTIQTVSKALKGRPGMSEETRSEVVRFARACGYLTQDQKHVLANDGISPYPLVRRRFVLLQNEQSLNFNRLLLAGLHERFTEFGHQVEPILVPPHLKPQHFPDWVEDTGISFAEGLFIAPRMSNDVLEALLLQLPIPRILLNFPPPESKVDSVIWDVYNAVYESVLHLRRLGHAQIMYVGDVQSQRGFRLRWQAFQEAIHTAILPPFQTVDSSSSWVPSFLLQYRTLKPTAILCGIDEQVAPVYHALLEAGVRIPEDCSFVGILNEQPDNLPAIARPQLAIKETGYRAADRLLWRLANPQLPYEHIRIQGDFYAGDTIKG